MGIPRARNTIMLGHRYVIRHEIGRGSMSAVYLAEDFRARRSVALKLLPREVLTEPGLAEQFEQVCDALAALDHPNIVPVYAHGEHEGQPYVVARYMEGVTLRGQLDLGALSLAEAADYVSQIAAALSYAHAQGVIHRDLKPSNVMFDDEGHLAVADFGLARLARPFARISGVDVVGTAGYLAPESARPDGISPLVDVYALGVMLYEMLAGHLPFQAGSVVEVLRAHLHAPVPNLLAERPDIPEGVQQVIARALAKDPAERTQSPLAFDNALRTAIEEAGERAFQPDITQVGGMAIDTPRRLTRREQRRLRQAEKRALARWQAAEARRAAR